MPDRNSLEIIVNDRYSTPEEREFAARELGGVPLSADTELPEAHRMLATLRNARISEVSEADWVNYFSQNHAPASEELIREWRYFVPPDTRTLELLTGQDHVEGLRWYWETTLSAAGERADVRAHALARLAELQ